MEKRLDTDYEIREYHVSELRADADTGEITGYAAVFNQKAPIWDYEEIVRSTAFNKTIADDADVFAFWNHESGNVIGRTKNGTLDLTADDHGLRVKIRPPDTPTAQEVRTLIRGGFVDKMSFGFRVLKDKWTYSDDPKVPDLREIQEVQLFEVSPVPIPAYDGTSVTARGAQPVRPKRDKPKHEETKDDTNTQDTPETNGGVTEPSRDQRSHSLSEVEKSRRRLALLQ